MFYALSWLFIVLFLALWSLTVWAMHAVSVWTVTNAGALTEAAAGVSTSVVPAWLVPWIPPEVAQSMNQLLASMGPVVDSLFQVAPALAGGVTITAWVIWAIGCTLLLLLGSGLNVLIALGHRGSSSGHAPVRLRWLSVDRTPSPLSKQPITY